jgi:hypothetical protein
MDAMVQGLKKRGVAQAMRTGAAQMAPSQFMDALPEDGAQQVKRKKRRVAE